MAPELVLVVDGATVLETFPLFIGATVVVNDTGAWDGMNEGDIVDNVGRAVGDIVVGENDGNLVDGALVSPLNVGLGVFVGEKLGLFDGGTDGRVEGGFDGKLVTGARDGKADGWIDGAGVVTTAGTTVKANDGERYAGTLLFVPDA